MNQKFWKGKKVFVTGAGGFIGSHLTEFLVRNNVPVKALVHYNSRNDYGLLEFMEDGLKKNIDIVAGDVLDAAFLEKATRGMDIIFHLAALIGIPFSYDSPALYLQTNALGTLNVMGAALKNDISKVVHTSTSEVYGTALYTPIDEKHPLQAQSPYSASKVSADKIAESHYLSYGLPVAVIRPFNTFGPRQSARAIIPTIILQALEKETIGLGSLDPVRDMNYVADTVEGFVLMAESDNSVGEAINIGRGEGVSVGDLVGMIGQALDKEIKVKEEKERVRPEKSEVRQLICDSSKAGRLIGWSPRFSLEEGLSETVKWFKDKRKLYRADRYVK